MGLIYGNIITDNTISDNYFSFIEFVNRSISDHDYMLETYLLDEESTSLAVIPGSDTKSEDGNKKKESLLSIIKNLFKRFVDFVKGLVDKLKEWYKKIKDGAYKDTLANKLLKDLKYEDLTKAKQKGWKGIPEASNYAMIDPATIEHEFYIFENVRDEIHKNNIVQSIEKIKDAENNHQAKELFDSVKKDIEDLKYYNFKPTSIQGMYNRVEHENFRRSLDRTFSSIRGEDGKPDVELLLLYHMKIDNGYWMPDARGFDHVKDYTFNGYKNIDKYSKETDKMVSDYKKAYVDPFDTIVSDIVSSTADNDRSIELMYYKAQLQVSQYMMRVYSGITQEIMSALKVQHDVAIKTYLYLFTSTRRYIKEA